MVPAVFYIDIEAYFIICPFLYFYISIFLYFYIFLIDISLPLTDWFGRIFDIAKFSFPEVRHLNHGSFSIKK